MLINQKIFSNSAAPQIMGQHVCNTQTEVQPKELNIIHPFIHSLESRQLTNIVDLDRLNKHANATEVISCPY